MNAFFTSLLYAAVAGGLSAAMVGKAYEKHIRYLAALLCTAVIVSPLLSLVPQLNVKQPDMESYAAIDKEAAEKLLTAQAAEDIEKTVADYIFSQTGIKVRRISIQIESKESALQITMVTAIVSTESEAKSVTGCLARLFENTVPTEVVADGENADTEAA